MILKTILLLALMQAPARRAADVAPAPAPDPYRRDIVRDFGAVPGLQGATATRKALQAAIASVPANNFSRVVIAIPPGRWYVDQPVWVDRSYVTLAGLDRDASSIEAGPGLDSTVLYLGHVRAGLSADHYVDAFGKLDADAAPRAGMRWGLRTKGDARPVFGASPFQGGATGDYWAKTSRLCLEMAFEGDARNAVFGGMSAQGDAHPFFIWSESAAGRLGVAFATSDGTLTGAKKWLATFVLDPARLAAASGTHRLIVQIEAEAGTVDAWLDGVPLAPKGRQDLPSGTLAGRTFRANQNLPFIVGHAHEMGGAFSNDWLGVPAMGDWTLLGLRLSAPPDGPRYRTDSDSGKVARVDGAEMTDLETFFAGDAPGLVAYLPLTDQPDDAAPVRRVTARGPKGRPFFGLMHLKGPQWFYADDELRDLTMRCGSPDGYGDALTAGSVLNLRLNRCRFVGGAHGVGNWGWGANYMWRIRDCAASGSESAWYWSFAMVDADGLELMGTGRSLITASMSKVRGRGWFVGGASPALETIVRNTRGTTMSVDGLDVDIESPKHGPTVTAFYHRASAYLADPSNSGSLFIRDLSLGTSMPGKPVFLLADPDGVKAPARVDLDGPFISRTKWSSLVDSGAAWTGTVSGGATSMTPLATPGTTTRIGVSPKAEVPP